MSGARQRGRRLRITGAGADEAVVARKVRSTSNGRSGRGRDEAITAAAETSSI